MLKRRSLAELDDWHASHREEVIDPQLKIIDAHHHMWWRPPESYQLPELVHDLFSGHDVRATVFVECTAMYSADAAPPFKPIGETEYANGAAAVSASGIFGPQRPCAGIVGYADLRQGDTVQPVLEAHIAAGGGRFRGIRQQAQADPFVGSLAKAAPPPGLLGLRSFREGFGRLAPLGLSFDAWIFFTQLGELVDLADAFPCTQIILNHTGGPLGIGRYANQSTEVFETWSQGVCALAKRPNVAVKLGGLGMAGCGFGFETRDVPAPSQDLAEVWRPFIDRTVEAFGASRCMFESNFPVDKQSYSYRTLWNAFKRLTTSYSGTEKSALFHDTANRIYRLGFEPSSPAS